jgi:hypothetical protein
MEIIVPITFFSECEQKPEIKISKELSDTILGVDLRKLP